MAYFKEIDPFGNVSCVYEADAKLNDNDIEIDAEEYIETSYEITEMNKDLYGDNDRGGPAI